MKKLFILIGLMFQISLYTTQAQNKESTAPPAANDQEVRKATENLTAKYALNADQAKQMYTVLQRKAKNTAQIESFQKSDPALYRAKMSNVQKGTLANIRRILNTKDQVDLYQKTQGNIRALRNKKQKELTAKKASKEEIETALLGIYAE